jgi:hypothetical protein
VVDQDVMIEDIRKCKEIESRPLSIRKSHASDTQQYNKLLSFQNIWGLDRELVIQYGKDPIWAEEYIDNYELFEDILKGDCKKLKNYRYVEQISGDSSTGEVDTSQADNKSEKIG